MNINELKQNKNEKLERLQAIKNEAEKAKRGLNEAEQKEVGGLFSEIEKLNTEIETAEKMERALKDLAKNTPPTERKENKEKYSLYRGVSNFLQGKRQGYEFNVHDEIQEKTGIVSRGLLFRASDMNMVNNAGLINVNASSAQNDIGQKPLWDKLGFNTINNCQGSYKDVFYPILKGSSVNEDGAYSSDSVTGITQTAVPKRHGIMRSTSLELIRSTDAAYITNFINRLIKGADRAFTAYVFSKIASSATEYATLSGMTSANMFSIVAKQEVQEKGSFLMDRTNFSSGAQTALDSGSGKFLFNYVENNEDIGRSFIGKQAIQSDLVASKAMLYGDLGWVNIYNYGVYELIEDPFSNKAKGEIEYVVNLVADATVNPYAWSKTGALYS